MRGFFISIILTAIIQDGTFSIQLILFLAGDSWKMQTVRWLTENLINNLYSPLKAMAVAMIKVRNKARIKGSSLSGIKKWHRGAAISSGNQTEKWEIKMSKKACNYKILLYTKITF